MNGFELNKIAASILIAGIIAMIAGNIADILYLPGTKSTTRGFTIDVTTAAPAAGPAQPVVKIDIGALMKTANATDGQNEAKKCSACHNFTQGGANRVGPDLWAVLGRKKAAHAGFNYSQALQSLGGTWTEDDLFHFISSPRTFAPGTKMTFVGISNPQKAADVIAYLKTLK